MRKVLASIFILLTQSVLVQGQNSSSEQVKEDKMKKADFITQIDIKQATKDGVYLNGYVVNIPYEKLTELNGKTVRITGKVEIVKGVGDFSGGEVQQGRQNDTMHIFKPRIRIIKH